MAGKSYWQYLIENLDFVFINKNVTIPAGQTVNLYNAAGKGFWFAGIISSNSKDVSLFWNLDGTAVKDKIESVYSLGLTQPNNFYFYIMKYDTSSNVYNMAWAPAIPTTFKQFCKVTLINDGATDATVTFFAYFVKVVKED